MPPLPRQLNQPTITPSAPGIVLASLAFGTLLLSGCALPKAPVVHSHDYAAFVQVASSPPQFQWAYCGSDTTHHHFAQWRYGAMLFHSGRSSYLKRHKVSRPEMGVKDEFPRTRDMDDWRYYGLMGGDRDGRFARDFLHEGDRIAPVRPRTDAVVPVTAPED